MEKLTDIDRKLDHSKNIINPIAVKKTKKALPNTIKKPPSRRRTIGKADGIHISFGKFKNIDTDILKGRSQEYTEYFFNATGFNPPIDKLGIWRKFFTLVKPFIDYIKSKLPLGL